MAQVSLPHDALTHWILIHREQALKHALVDRQERWRQFRRFISARARAQFMYLLSERSFRGVLKTDHKLRVLDLHVGLAVYVLCHGGLTMV